MTEQSESPPNWPELEAQLQDHWTCLKPLRGYTTTLDDVKKVINIYERCTNTSYIYLKQDKCFGKRESVKDLETCRVFYKDREGDKDVVGDDGVPFFSLGSMVLGCHLGIDKHRKEKEEKKDKDEENAKGDHVFLKKRRYVQDTKKKDCKATIYVKEVLKFPQLKLSSDSKDERNATSLKVKQRLSLNEIGTKRFYIRLPPLDAHDEYNSTSTGATLFNPIHPLIRDKIHTLVGEGVSRVSEMRRHVNIFIKTHLAHEQPSPGDRRYFPSNRDIRNHINCTQIKNRYSKIDQVNLKHKVEEWKRQYQNDSFKYRSCRADPAKAFKEDESDDLHDLKTSLLFCHQTAWQKRLLARYGNEMCFLDATYRTTRYSIPLFFLVVKTNVGYTAVGSFAVQHETKEAVKEALEQFKEWNPNWTPSFFLTDFSEVEIQSIEEVFQGCFVYLCDFHREQAWLRWTKAGKNGCSNNKERILNMLRRISRASTVEHYHKALKSFKDSLEWKESSQLQKWYSNQWEPVYKRWVWAFRKDRMNCKLNTNNGIERQNRTFKHNYLSGFKNNSLSGMLEVMITVFLPEKYQEYIKHNIKANENFGKTYNQTVPEYLRNRPRFFSRKQKNV